LRVVGGAVGRVVGGTVVLVVEVVVDVDVVVVDVEVVVVAGSSRRGSSLARLGNPATATPRPAPITSNRARAQPCFRTPRQ
jgi:hypothetical protein